MSGTSKRASRTKMTLPQAAAALGIRPDTLRAQVHRKRLIALKLGRDWLVDEEEVDRYRRESLRSKTVAATTDLASATSGLGREPPRAPNQL
jgi:excisionase family DNA binding protein